MKRSDVFGFNMPAIAGFVSEGYDQDVSFSACSLYKVSPGILVQSAVGIATLPPLV